MPGIPYVESPEAFTTFTMQPGVSVVMVGMSVGGLGGTLNDFIPELAGKIAAFSSEVRMVVAAPSALSAIAGDRPVTYQDILIIADGKLYWRTEGPSLGDALATFLSAAFPQSSGRSQYGRNEVALLQVKMAVLERTLKNSQTAKKKARPTQPAKQPPIMEPHAVLGLSPNCTWEQVRKARNELLSQYHPDKVASAGPKLRNVAEAETKLINAAYEQLERTMRPSKRK